MSRNEKTFKQEVLDTIIKYNLCNVTKNLKLFRYKHL